MLIQAGEAELERLRLRSLEIDSTSTLSSVPTYTTKSESLCLLPRKEDIPFEAISKSSGNRLSCFVNESWRFSSTHTNRHLCWLNRLIYIAVDQEILRSNPIEEVAYEKKNSPKLKHITRSQLKRMVKTPMPNEAQELAQSVYIFIVLWFGLCGFAAALSTSYRQNSRRAIVYP